MKSLYHYSINEMAVTRNEFVDKIQHRARVLIQHIALVKYANETSDVNLEHWSTEVYSIVAYIQDLTIKKNNSVSFRKKAIEQSWVKEYDLNDLAKVKRTIWSKLQYEHISKTDSDRLSEYVLSRLSDIISICASTLDDDKIMQFINSLK